MKSSFKFQKPTRIEGYVFGAVGGIILVALLIWGVASWIDSLKSYPLDNKLVYIGKETLPCNIGFTPSGFNFGRCKQRAVYYYATDLSFSDVIKDFPHASISTTSLYSAGSGTTPPFYSSNVKDIPWQSQPMQFAEGEIAWYIYYYNNGKAVAKALSKATPKAHAIRIDASDYEAIHKYGL